MECDIHVLTHDNRRESDHGLDCRARRESPVLSATSAGEGELGALGRRRRLGRDLDLQHGANARR